MIHFFAETISARERINNRANFFSLLLFSVNILLLNLVYINWPSLRHTEEMALASEPDKQQRSRLLRVTTDNVHENEQQKIDKTTRLSKKDSSGQGALTENYGLNYLSPFHEFQNLMQQSQPASANDNPSAPPGNEKQQSVQDPEQTSRDFQIIANQTGIFRISLPKAIAPKPQPEANAKPTRSKPKQAEIQELYFRKIPEFYQFRSEFALRISNSDQEFSFNTVKYPDYKYFQDMKKEIQRNWYRHAPAGGVFLGNFNSSYTPGFSRVITFRSGEAKIAFVLNRKGDITDIKIIEAHPSEILTEACFKAIEDSGNFGPLPESIDGEYLIIPFQFIYIVR